MTEAISKVLTNFCDTIGRRNFLVGGLRGVLGSGCGLSSSCGGILWDDGTQAIPPSLSIYCMVSHHFSQE